VGGQLLRNQGALNKPGHDIAFQDGRIHPKQHGFMALFTSGETGGRTLVRCWWHGHEQGSYEDAWCVTSCVLLCPASCPAGPLSFRELVGSPQRAVLSSSTAQNTSAAVAGGSGLSGEGQENRGGCTTILD
jgi:hypothetical protein